MPNNYKLWDIWRPFSYREYREAWGYKNILGVIRQFFRDIKYCWQRCRKGFCDSDLYNIDAWFLDIMPRMLEQFKDTLHGAPVLEGTTEETCHDEWAKILDRMIFLMREASEDTCTKTNPYEAEYDRISNEFREKYGKYGEKLYTAEDRELAEKGLGYRSYSPCNLPEYEDIVERYFDECNKLEQYRESCKNQALDMFKKYFRHLWD